MARVFPRENHTRNREEKTLSIQDLLLQAAACWSLVEYIHHGEILQPVRDLSELAEASGSKNPLLIPVRAVRCPFCLSFWAAIFVYLLYIFGLTWPLWILAISGLARLINDLSYHLNRTPKDRPDLSGIELEQLEEEYVKRTGQDFGD